MSETAALGRKARIPPRKIEHSFMQMSAVERRLIVTQQVGESVYAHRVNALFYRQLRDRLRQGAWEGVTEGQLRRYRTADLWIEVDEGQPQAKAGARCYRLRALGQAYHHALGLLEKQYERVALSQSDCPAVSRYQVTERVDFVMFEAATYSVLLETVTAAPDQPYHQVTVLSALLPASDASALLAPPDQAPEDSSTSSGRRRNRLARAGAFDVLF